METTLHRQLKALYAPQADCREVRVDGFRIDAVTDGRLVEIQSAPLGAIRDKLRTLLERYEVLVVKPLAARKTLIRRSPSPMGRETVRASPRRESVHDLFVELVNLVPALPHPRLTLDVLLTEQEEIRVPTRRRRRRGRDYRVADRRLVRVLETFSFQSAEDFARLLPPGLPPTFTTLDVARLLERPRWLAQKMTYCLRRMHVIQDVGVAQRSRLYTRCSSGSRAA